MCVCVCVCVKKKCLKSGLTFVSIMIFKNFKYEGFSSSVAGKSTIKLSFGLKGSTL